MGAREARRVPGRQRPGQKHLSQAGDEGSPCPCCRPAAKVRTSYLDQARSWPERRLRLNWQGPGEWVGVKDGSSRLNLCLKRLV